MADPTAVKLGPGLLRIAPIGTTEPATLTGAYAAEWTEIGYTEEGHEFSHEQQFEDIDVAEEFYPIDSKIVKVVASVNFSAAEITATNLSHALNGGVVSTPSGGFVTFDPPDPNDIVRVMLGWDSDDAQERWIFRRVVNKGTVAIPRRKAPDKALLPFEFSLEKPAGLQPFRAFFDEDVA